MHQINKSNMVNDIILTLSLIISVSIVKLFMIITNLTSSQYESTIFFNTCFIMIKTIYFSLTALYKRKKVRLY